MQDLRAIIFAVAALAAYHGSIAVLGTHGVQGWSTIGLASLFSFATVNAGLRMRRLFVLTRSDN